MDLVSRVSSFVRTRFGGRLCTWGLVPALWTCCVLGCDDRVRMPTQEQRTAFEQAASMEPRVDMDRLRKAKLRTGPYRVVSGDVLEFTMPGLLLALTAAEAAQTQPHADSPCLCRVSEAGTITLPGVGELKGVAGLPLAEIEEKVIEAYQAYAAQRPSVFARVLEYRTSKVYIAGAVENPGVYALPSDQMTLVSLLTEAGGVAPPKANGTTAGATVVRIVRSDPPSEAGPFTGASSVGGPPTVPAIVLPVLGMSIPLRDVSLEEGDTVVVEQVQVPLFTVAGLVNKPGNYEYPPAAQYNLMQAIGFAGGLDLVADPHYAMIYRFAPDGSITRIPFRLVAKNEFTEAMNTPVRPGDVIAIEQTPRTRMNAALRQMVHFNTGVYVNGRDLWD